MRHIALLSMFALSMCSSAPAFAQVLPLPQVERDMVPLVRNYLSISDLDLYKPKTNIRLDETLTRLLYKGFFDRLEETKPTAVLPGTYDGVCHTVSGKYQHENPMNKKHDGFIPPTIPETKTDVTACLPPANGMGPH